MKPNPPAALIACLQRHKIPAGHIAALQGFVPRDGFQFHPDDSDWQNSKDYFDECQPPLPVAPLLQDGERNEWFVYLTAPLAGMVGHFQHDAPDLAPTFADIPHLIAAVAAHPEAQDGYDLLHVSRAGQFPAAEPPLDTAVRQAAMRQLQEQAEQGDDEEIRQRLHLAWFNLVAENEAAQWLLPYLDDEDMYVQERAIELVGRHNCRAAREKRQMLQTTALPNGQTAAKRVLAEWRKQESGGGSSFQSA